MAGNRQRDRGDGDDWGIRRLRTVAGAGRVFEIPAKLADGDRRSKREIGNMESEHHILPSSDVEELELRLESIGESTATGNLTLLGGLHPTASYTERDGGRGMPSLQNQDELTFSDCKSYMLSVLCMGEGSVSIEWTLGTQSEQRNLECAQKIAETALGMSNVNAKSSTVKIVAKEGSKAEIAYRLDEIGKPGVIVD